MDQADKRKHLTKILKTKDSKAHFLTNILTFWIKSIDYCYSLSLKVYCYVGINSRIVWLGISPFQSSFSSCLLNKKYLLYIYPDIKTDY